jgi:hypothetical protein
MSFDELLEQARSEPNYEKIYNGIAFIVRNKNTYYFARFIEPFLLHVASDNFTLFHKSVVERKSYESYFYLIRDMMDECRTNKRLLQVLDVAVQKHI